MYTFNAETLHQTALNGTNNKSMDIWLVVKMLLQGGLSSFPAQGVPQGGKSWLKQMRVELNMLYFINQQSI